MKKCKIQNECLGHWDRFCNREISLDEMVDTLLRVSNHHKAPDKRNKNTLL